MNRRTIEVLSSSVIIFAAGFIVWPPFEDLLWWEAVPITSDLTIIATIMALCISIGVGISAVSGIRPSNLTFGGILAYLTGMVAITITIPTDSPAHFLLYGMILILFLLGAAVWTVVTSD